MKRILLAIISCVFLQMTVNGQTDIVPGQTITSIFPVAGSAFNVPVAPAGGHSLTVKVWGGGGAGGSTAGSLVGSRAGGGGGGGAYVSAALSGLSGATLNIAVAEATAGSSGNAGSTGGSSSVTHIGTGVSIVASGGQGGAYSNSGGTSVGGLGGTYTSSITVDGTSSVGGSGLSGSAGTGISGAGGSGGNGTGGAGGAAIDISLLGSNNGNAGTAPGGGGGGAVSAALLGSGRTGGAGAPGSVIVIYTCPVYSLTLPATAEDACSSSGTSLVKLESSTAGLPSGDYTVTYSIDSPAKTDTALMTVSDGTGTFIVTGLTTPGLSTITVTKLASGTFCFTDILTNNTANTVTITVRPNLTAGAINTTGETICYNEDPSVIGSSTAASGGDNSITYEWRANGVSIPSSNSATYDPPAGLTATTTYTRYAKDATCNTLFTESIGSWVVTVNPLPTAPTIGAITQPTCALPAGSVVLSGLPASWTLTQSGTSDATIIGTGASTTVSGLAVGTYSFTVSDGTCTSVTSANVEINPLITNTYNGTWSNGVPNSNMNIIFTANYSSTGNLSGCSCQVISGDIVINSGHTLAITNAVTVSGGTLTFEDDASLVQINDVLNTGNITYKRETTTISKSDYTYWSSPVSPQKLYDVSPNTLSGKFYSFNAAIDNWKQENSQNLMTKGIGYIIAGPQDYGTTSPPVPPSVYEANFIGVPNNGTFSLNSISADKWYLIGNPYPSALDANAFLDANSTVLDGTIYFWTHNTAIQLASNITNGTAGSGVYAYTSDDYATYNRVGGVGTKALAPGENSNAPSGKIAAGQSFFAATKASIPSNQIVFNNTMRVGVGGITGDNTQFFKMNTSSKMTDVAEKNRVWLNLTNTQGAFKQTLVGYVTGATNGYEGAYDGESFDGNDYVDFYSINQDKNLTIQGRALPFDVTDAVPLGYKTTIAGTFSIGIDHVDGLLASQDILLEDKVTQTVQNLKEGAYSFTTATGSFNNRFVLRYANKTLGTADFKTLENSVLVSTKNKQITINSSVDSIDKIQVYDMLGRQIYKKLNVDTTEFSIPNLVIEEQVLIVKVILKNGNTVTNKIILK